MALRGAGYRELTGVDRNPALGAAFEGTAIRYRALQIEPDLKLEGAFHTIVLNNVVEHFLDPAHVLAQCRAALAEQGQILMLTPNAASWCHRFFGRFWSGLHAPRHPQIFSPGPLQRLAAKAGFAEAEVSFVADPASWAIFLPGTWTRRGRDDARGGARHGLVQPGLAPGLGPARDGRTLGWPELVGRRRAAALTERWRRRRCDASLPCRSPPSPLILLGMAGRDRWWPGRIAHGWRRFTFLPAISRLW